MHILEAALIQALVETAQTQADRRTHQTTQPDRATTARLNPIETGKAQVAVNKPSGWRRWFERQRSRVTA
ncbi:hypothetical protein ASE36_02020 [Rhizobium sp. Root274]|uniref:hypothetical protein n=1 Tax=unclassified Rhizobium TaxID=2613769 RepID=UPI0007125BEC|nr:MULTISPECIES: hypothetical protein [unclassified Rhizobium]KQW31087.1 hypothetical protein ASC71_02020 [Rhizobium sp. Root1240]KRD32633.1 hypothetical protein ASE36_02020 [Rhizobium sp. Root274]